MSSVAKISDQRNADHYDLPQVERTETDLESGACVGGVPPAGESQFQSKLHARCIPRKLPPNTFEHHIRLPKFSRQLEKLAHFRSFEKTAIGKVR